jgi:putative ABC transport system permease protein
MQTLWHDVRYALRGFRKQPGFTVLAVLTLALGIGAATTIFSVIQNVLLDPFPYTDASRVAMIQIRDATNPRPFGRTGFQTPEFLDYQEQNHVFDGVIGGTNEDVLSTTREGTEQFTGGLVTPNTFSFLGVPPLIGRTLTPDDAKPGAPPVFVMAYRMWLRQHNLDPGVLGRTYTLNGVPTTVVGVMPPRFTKLAADLWRPVVLDRGNAAISQRYFVLQARLKPGVTLQQAEADLDVVARRLATVYPRNYPPKFTVRVVSWVDSLVGQFRKTLYMLAGAVALLLLIACGNVANMLLARASAREKEMAIRASLGASRWRVVRQLLVESLLLALCGAAAGAVLAYAGIKALVPLIPDGLIPREAVIRLNVPVLLFSLALSAVTSVVFGLVPALHAAKRDVVESLKDSSKGANSGFRRGRLRNALVVVEVALSLVLLVGAGLLMRSFVALQQVDLGLNPDNILVVRLPLPRGQYDTAEAKTRLFRPLLQRLHALPGVVAATETSTLPPYGGITTDMDIPGRTHTERWETMYQLCSEGYFTTLGLRLMRGRVLSAADVNDARKVAVVNQTLVTRYFGTADPIGSQIKLNNLETPQNGGVQQPLFEIIGVISDAKNRGIQEPPMPEAFIPYTITGAFQRGILVRTAADPNALLNAVRREIWTVDRNVALTNTGSLAEFLKQFSYAEPRFSLVLLGVFAGLGLVLVALGVYSVIAYTVAQQTHEIGIHMALGADRARVLWMVVSMGLRLVVLGIVAGVLVSLAAARVLASQLWGVAPHDPVTFAGVVAVLACAGLAACYFPARRATGVNPIIALRSE